MLRHYAGDAAPTEVGFRRQQILSEVLRDEAACYISQSRQDQHPCKKEMKRPHPDRGTDDKRNRKINERRGFETADYAPVQARVRYENACAADKQTNCAEHVDPVSDTNERDMAQGGSRLNRYFNASFANHDLSARNFRHHRTKKESQQYKSDEKESQYLVNRDLGNVQRRDDSAKSLVRPTTRPRRFSIRKPEGRRKSLS